MIKKIDTQSNESLIRPNKYWRIAVILFLGVFNFSQSSAQPPKREMRATWLATVGAIDWPKSTTAAMQKTEMTRMLDSIQSLNMNAVFFQVRSRCDAMYNSAYEPWSSDLKINRGTTPEYDPLAFVLEECHKRGLECHAWLNPYRYNNSGATWTGNHDHPLNYEHTHPEWLLYYTSNIILDPALPDVRFRIKSVVGDLLSKYDVDGIIFDDYFYAYGGTTNQDAASQATYKPSGMNVHDWRRNNVNRMIADVYDTIQAVKPWVTFGVSPFGIWTTDASVAAKEGISLPSGITGGNMYQEIYCDPVAWLKQGTVDYISPQLYWKTGGGQDYNKLCPWWADLANRFGVQFYSSMANYKYAEKTDAAYTVTELANQSSRNRSTMKDDAPGHVFYNTQAWVFDAPFRKKFREEVFTAPALPPAIGWKRADDQDPVSFVAPSGSTINWTHNSDANVRYAVYAVPHANRNDPHIFSSSRYLLGIVYDLKYKLPTGISTSSHKIAVSVIDHYGNEYAPRVMGENPAATATAAQLTYPANNIAVIFPLTFRWEAVTGADCYVWQLARDAHFTDIVATRETTVPQFDSSLQMNIKDNERYYWRVKTRKVNANDIWSETRVIANATDISTVAQETLDARLQGDYLVVDATKPAPLTVRVYNLSGQLLSLEEHALQYGENTFPLNLMGINKGVYLVQIQMDDKTQTLKVNK
jgi:uncharacterized lipoprotein YddW (UPF0748 family)